MSSDEQMNAVLRAWREGVRGKERRVFRLEERIELRMQAIEKRMRQITPLLGFEDAGAALTRQFEGLSFDNQSDAPPCPTCGEIMVRNGSCYKCLNCGGTSGCS